MQGTWVPGRYNAATFCYDPRYDVDIRNEPYFVAGGIQLYQPTWSWVCAYCGSMHYDHYTAKCPNCGGLRSPDALREWGLRSCPYCGNVQNPNHPTCLYCGFTHATESLRSIWAAGSSRQVIDGGVRGPSARYAFWAAGGR